MEPDELQVGDRIEYFAGARNYTESRIGKTGTLTRVEKEVVKIEWDDHRAEYHNQDSILWIKANVRRIEPTQPEMPVPKFFEEAEDGT